MCIIVVSPSERKHKPSIEFTYHIDTAVAGDRNDGIQRAEVYADD